MKSYSNEITTSDITETLKNDVELLKKQVSLLETSQKSAKKSTILGVVASSFAFLSLLVVIFFHKIMYFF